MESRGDDDNEFEESLFRELMLRVLFLRVNDDGAGSLSSLVERFYYYYYYLLFLIILFLLLLLLSVSEAVIKTYDSFIEGIYEYVFSKRLIILNMIKLTNYKKQKFKFAKIKIYKNVITNKTAESLLMLLDTRLCI